MKSRAARDLKERSVGRNSINLQKSWARTDGEGRELTRVFSPSPLFRLRLSIEV
jgi:hypothetical protein